MIQFRILPGLPPYGAVPRAFPADWSRLGREGIVVEFTALDAPKWVGNFAPGLAALVAVLEHPDGKHVLVIAGGDLWVVDPIDQSAELVLHPVDAIWLVESPAGFIFSLQGLSFARFGEEGTRWRTRRISWDGFDAITIRDAFLSGLAWNPMGDVWQAFEVNIATGATRGGSYAEPDAERWEQLASERSAL